MKSITPAEAFKKALDCLLQGIQMEAWLLDWFCNGLKAFAEGNCSTVEEGLGINVRQGGAHQKVCRVILASERNKLICKTARFIDGSPNYRATIMSEYLKGSITKQCEDFEDEFWINIDKLKTDFPRTPKSRQQLKRILDEEFDDNNLLIK